MTEPTQALVSKITNTVELDSRINDKIELVSKIPATIELDSRIADESIYETLP